MASNCSQLRICMTAEPRNKQESARLTLLTQETICFWGLPQENDTVLSQPAISTTSMAPYPVWSLSSASQLRWNEVISAVMSRFHSINYNSYNRMDDVDLKKMFMNFQIGSLSGYKTLSKWAQSFKTIYHYHLIVCCTLVWSHIGIEY